MAATDQLDPFHFQREKKCREIILGPGQEGRQLANLFIWPAVCVCVCVCRSLYGHHHQQHDGVK